MQCTGASPDFIFHGGIGNQLGRTVSGALHYGTGWEEHVFIHPTETGVFYKTSYYRRTTGNDGTTYIVASGNYKACET
jgi:hypothetical protein